MTVLIDGAVGGNQKINSFIDRGLLAKDKLVPLTGITATTQADIEDMFDIGSYLKLLNASKVGKSSSRNSLREFASSSGWRRSSARNLTTSSPPTSC